MGYNNHNTGMHFVWYRRYAAYDDLEYYDRLAEKKRKDNETSVLSSGTVIVKKDEDRTQEKEVDKHMNQQSEKTNTDKQNAKPKDKKKQRDTQFPQKPVYGAEKVIGIDDFISTDIVTKNLMLMALKRKIEI